MFKQSKMSREKITILSFRMTENEKKKKQFLITWNINENMWNADGTWNKMRNATQTTCHKPIWPISSEMQSPESSISCGSWWWRWCFGSASIWIFARFDSDVTLPIIRLSVNDFSSHFCDKFVTHALFLLFNKFSRKWNIFCQKLGLLPSFSVSSLESDIAISMRELFNVSAVSMAPDAANRTFCRKFSPDATKPSLLFGSDAIVTINILDIWIFVQHDFFKTQNTKTQFFFFFCFNLSIYFVRNSFTNTLFLFLFGFVARLKKKSKFRWVFFFWWIVIDWVYDPK